MNKHLIFASLLLSVFFTIPFAKADVLPESSQEVTYCSNITNISEFTSSGSKFVLFGVTSDLGSGEVIDVQNPKNNDCLGPIGYKLNAYNLYITPYDNPIMLIAPGDGGADGSRLTIERFHTDKRFIPFSESLFSGPEYINNPTNISLITTSYKILGFKDKILHIYKAQEVTTYNDETPDKIETFLKPDTTGISTEFPSTEEAIQDPVIACCSGPIPFLDIADSFAKDMIGTFYRHGIVKGRSSVEFAPRGTLNRAEAIKLVVHAFYGEEKANTSFAAWKIAHPNYTYVNFIDVPVVSWFAAAVEYGIEKKMISLQRTQPGFFASTEDGRQVPLVFYVSQFNPSDLVTRAEFLKMVLTAAESNGTFEYSPSLEAMAENIRKNKDSASFTDVVPGSWYELYVFAGAYMGMIDVNPMFFPARPLTREEAVKILWSTPGMYKE